ncbi:MAG: S8 family serine peptidase, partial [Actinomycetota bacterium]|nr:S8 family serine peptidase [Actinomycetota bacterium]
LIASSITVLLAFTVSTGQALSQPNPGETQPASDETPFAPGRILVKVEDSAPANALASVNRENGASVEEKIPDSQVSVVDLPEGLSVAEAVEVYEGSAVVEYAEPDYQLTPTVTAPTPSDPSFSKMYTMYNTGQLRGTADADLDAREAWNTTTGSPETVVAVIDTGMDITHKDLNGNIWTNPGESGLDAAGNDKATNGVDDDNNGKVDDVHGWDFRNEDNSVYDGAKQDSHATHIAGTIAAEGNNDLGVTGINWQAKIMPLKFIGADGVGYVSDAVEALNYAVAQGVEISNNSYGFYDSCGGCYARALQNAIADADRAGHLFVTAAGNGGADWVGDDNEVVPFYPASYSNPNIIAVAASNSKDELTSFSNYGTTSVDLAAPGKDVLSTLPDDKYGYGLGTSVATPHVTGVAALYKSRFSQASDTDIKASILGSVDQKPAMVGKLLTGGRLNAARALGENTAPVIADLRPGGRTRDRTPLISATVRDQETDLAQSQIQLYINGNQKLDFSYDQTTDTLTYNSTRLGNRRHKVQIFVADGHQLEEIRSWSFFAGRRR